MPVAIRTGDHMPSLADLLLATDRRESAIILPETDTEIAYGSLSEQVERLACCLRQSGLRPGQTVAIALPNGIEFLVSFLAATRARLVAAPMNAALKVEEFRFLLENSEARVVITTSGTSPIRDAASASNLPIWTPSRTATGDVELSGPGFSSSTKDVPDAPVPEDIALLMHTSGTTGRPKAVALTHANLMASVRNISAHYALSPADTGLVVMPLFHGHGLIGATLSSLCAGARIVLPDRFSAHAFWPLVEEHAVTWYSAVPTIHEILLVRAVSDHAPSRSGLRFVRSCSSPLSSSTMKRLEDRFAAPVIEAYAMTETSHQATSNPLPPGVRKPGTVGRGTNVEVGILGDGGKLLEDGTEGEVVVRGETVMHGYSRNLEATRQAFTDGWYLTGDLGMLDRDGYLRLTGRIKELINRGGEKISPSQVDAVLLGHPAVAMAASFPVPDPIYGEEIHAAVVRRAEVTAAELQTFCRSHLSAFEIPKVIHFVDELPRNATHKLDRQRLTELFSK
jgi:acyl-CoA synthetase (AMP-forming)/AMP-acid ligase II